MGKWRRTRTGCGARRTSKPRVQRRKAASRSPRPRAAKTGRYAAGVGKAIARDTARSGDGRSERTGTDRGIGRGLGRDRGIEIIVTIVGADIRGIETDEIGTIENGDIREKNIIGDMTIGLEEIVN